MYGKLMIHSNIKVLTGLHIGGSSVFSAIGAVDKTVVRDLYTNNPIIPGSSLKGKLRTLLSRSLCNGQRRTVEQDPPAVKRLFGATGDHIILSRLQFSDSMVTEESIKTFQNIGMTEIKYENAINRLTAVANPRQIERVVPGVCFACRITYTLENEAELLEDMKNLAHAMKLLQMDYLGGYGTRGSGRVSFTGLRLTDPDGLLSNEDMERLRVLFEDVEAYEVLPV